MTGKIKGKRRRHERGIDGKYIGGLSEQEMFKGWEGFINTANQLWDQMVKWQPTEKTTIDGKEVEIPKYFEIEDDKFGKIVFGEESFQGSMMTAEKQILEGTAAIKTLESIYADKKLSAEQATGRFQRSVGNYANALKDLRQRYKENLSEIARLKESTKRARKNLRKQAQRQDN